MKEDTKDLRPNHTAERTALWRALHVKVDALPHIIEDEVGLALLAPGESWRNRPDMDVEATRRIRASMVARARFVEDRAIEGAGAGVYQYVILGAGLDSFTVRRQDVADRLKVFEVDQPETLQWKERRLRDMGFALPQGLRFVPVDFEKGSWWEELLKAGFDPGQPTVVSCTGVSLYLTRDAILDTLRRIAGFAPGSTLAMTFILPAELIPAEERPMQKTSEKGASAGGTPFVSFFSPEDMLALAREAGFPKMQIVSGNELGQRYFAGRTDGLFPSNSEQFLVAET